MTAEERPSGERTPPRFVVLAAGAVCAAAYCGALGAIVYGTMIGERTWTITGGAVLAVATGAVVYLTKRWGDE